MYKLPTVAQLLQKATNMCKIVIWCYISRKLAFVNLRVEITHRRYFLVWIRLLQMEEENVGVDVVVRIKPGSVKDVAEYFR